MRIDLLKQGNSYKANLHCHSIISDGHKTPEKLKEDYKAHGYSVLCISDHNLLVNHSDLNDKDFLLLTGYEADITANKMYYNGLSNHTPTVHMNFIARKPDNEVIPLYNPKYVFADSTNRKDTQKHLGDGEYERSFANINGFVKKHTENGFLAAFNHPNWSMADITDMATYEGFYAMEICNYGCYTEGFPEIDDIYYEAMLRRGKKWYCIATDDNHNWYDDTSSHCDSYGGFTVIKADSLTYDNMISALENGEFYASMGPEIKEFYVEEDGDKWFVHIKTSPCVDIAFKTYGRRSKCVKGEKPGDEITEGKFEIQPLYDRYIRAYVKDKEGRYAWTNAYFDPCKKENGKFEYFSPMYR